MTCCKKVFVAEPSAIPKVHDFVENTLRENGVGGVSTADIVLACDETATNIVEHAFDGAGRSLEPRPEFILTLRCDKHKVTATFFDSGNSFDLHAVAPPDIRKNLAGERRGGYGVFLIRKLVDKIVYSARRRLNVTRLVKEVKA
ncbi:MAG: ATP-binding protein [Leptospiraceae bacterium]|nr:ATP-binding protein [Leptospiraceae bacterium]